MNRLKCIIVDDDEIDRLTVLSYARRFPVLEVTGVFSSAEEAAPAIAGSSPDVLFLDIDMEGASGIELRKSALSVPACVFITAHPEHAAESFEVETLDFIVKPLNPERFARTVARIEEYMQIRAKAALFESGIGGDAIYLKEGYRQVKILLHEVLYLEALKDYTLIVTRDKKHCVLSGLGELLKDGHFRTFVRIHRSFAVQKQFITKTGPRNVTLNDAVELPVGRSYKHELSALL
jgi:two-component system, LytTR family, response regulator